MILQGDSEEELKSIADESVDLLCTDPPYGYSFMGKSWDKTLPNIEIFKQCFRVLKPGAFAFVMSAPRSDVCARMMLMLEDSGFEIGFTPIYWTYASGFPKAMNIGKMVDKRLGAIRKQTGTKEVTRVMDGSDYSGGTVKAGTIPTFDTPATAAAAALNGSYGGFQPKPAVEVVIVAMKPLSEKTFVDQALKNGKGITWLDQCRIPTTEKWSTNGMHDITGGKLVGSTKQRGAPQQSHEAGRFPANLLVSDDVLNDGRVQKSGVAGRRNKEKNGYEGGWGSVDTFFGGFGDSGSYSRYFSLDAWAKTLPFLIVPKASKREKNEGLEGFEKKQSGGMSGTHDKTLKTGSGNERDNMAQNHHPTVKPLTLMSYLITLGSRPGDVVLDPFLGSGTTALAAKQLGRKYIGIEREQEYVDIAEARLNTVQPTLV